MNRAALSLAFALFSASALAAMKPGDIAPDFTIPVAQGGRDSTFSLKDALKKGPVVLYFYPKSFTSVCTVEAHEFAESMDRFAEMGASVIGVSGDKIETQRDFSAKECRDKFPVGADTNLAVAKSYDAAFNLPVAGALFASRISYVISPEGKIISALEDGGARPHIEKALAAVKEWRDAQRK